MRAVRWMRRGRWVSGVHASVRILALVAFASSAPACGAPASPNTAPCYAECCGSCPPAEPDAAPVDDSGVYGIPDAPVSEDSAWNLLQSTCGGVPACAAPFETCGTLPQVGPQCCHVEAPGDISLVATYRVCDEGGCFPAMPDEEGASGGEAATLNAQRPG